MIFILLPFLTSALNVTARERISQEDFGMKPTTAKARMCNDWYQLNTQLVW